jgi:AraC-like DNA-binding protein
MNLFRKSKNRLALKFLISYALILLIPLSVSAFAYREAAKMMSEDVLNSNMSMLEQTRDVVDSRLEEVNKIVNQLSLNTKVRSLGNLKSPLEANDHYNLRELTRELMKYTVTDDFISTFFITYKNSGIVVSPTSYYDLTFFYDTFFKFGDFNFDRWNNEILGAKYLDNYIPSTNIKFEEKNFSGITCVRTIIKEYTTDNVTLTLFIDEKDIQKLLGKINYYKNGWVYIIDGKGNILTQVSENTNEFNPVEIPKDSTSGHFERKIGKEDLTVVYANSTRNDWRYVSVVPSRIVMDRVRHIRNISLGVFLFSLILGILIAIYLSYKKSRPILEILQMTGGTSENNSNEKVDEYEVIKTTFSDMIVKNNGLEQAIKAQIPIMKSAFLNNLIKGEYRTEAELVNIMKQIGLNIEGENYSVVLIDINGYYVNINEEVAKELTINRAIIENLINQNVDNGYIHFVDENKIALLLEYNSIDLEDCHRNAQNVIDNISKQLQENHTFSIVFAAGEVYKDLLHIVQSYEEAVKVLEYKLMKRKKTILWYRDMPVRGEGYYYPIDFEGRIINVAKAGDYDAIKVYLGNVYDENIVKRNLSVDMMIRLFHDMKDTIYKINGDIGEKKTIENRTNSIKCNNDTEEVFKNFDSVYKEICEVVNLCKKESEDQLLSDIKMYIENNYMDVNLSPGVVAAQFNISEAYFPHFFKAEMGETFSSVLEDKRIRKACELLSTELTIKDIAEKVGYSGDKTFRRAFKRVKGVSPSEYSGR